MKRSELKKIIKECVRETLFEEGVLSDMIAEVAYGITKAQGLLAETKTPQQSTNFQTEEDVEERKEAQRQKLLETKRKMLDAIGGEKMQGIFEGTEALPAQGGSSQHSPLSGKDPNDAGVDISNLFSLAGQKWNALK